MIRAVEGPLASVRGEPPETVKYAGAAEPLGKLWVAVRANLRAVLEETTIADIASGDAARRDRGDHERPAGLGHALARTFVASSDAFGRLREHPRLALAHVDDLAVGELELVGLRLGQLRPARSRRPGSVNSTRTSKPRCTILSTCASVLRAVRLEHDLDVVRADERVAHAG